MSYMTTTMSVRHIWGFDRGDAELGVARSRGWRRTDLTWERLMEAGNQAVVADQPRRAGRLFLQAYWLGRLFQSAEDPRRATSLAARSAVCVRSGKIRQATALQRKALLQWKHAAEFVRKMEIQPRARSSLFHLRMETRHRETYHDNLRHRLGLICTETERTLRQLTAATSSRHRHFGRWKGEKPSVHDDTRKFLAACLLIPDA